ncbi:uracil-DNA glycosylase family protein [Halopenitus sp. POP-27]|uniref:uracil-DNA glycosylase n=1 Tax=Halopenitus sp. POP-27 TaxID=2994425 RepID=UPI0024684233|nr:uracil-DNA glycosylase family protein [Halopenitus sp. POP-27]
MDAAQTDFENPFGMDTDCANCSALCAERSTVVHGYGDVGGEFLVVGGEPSAGADETGIPFGDDEGGRRVRSIFRELGFVRSAPETVEMDVQNAFFTALTRCRHPDRSATDEEVASCEPYLDAEIRMINPQIIVPVGQRALEALAFEYTTRSPDSFDVAAEHATTIRGRGFELVPLRDPETMSDEAERAFIDHVRENVLARDYRQTKGRRSR